MSLPDSMYDYRGIDSNHVSYKGECQLCGLEVYSNDEYRYINDVIFHDDCADEYMRETEEEDCEE